VTIFIHKTKTNERNNKQRKNNLIRNAEIIFAGTVTDLVMENVHLFLTSTNSGKTMIPFNLGGARISPISVARCKFSTEAYYMQQKG
jgi:hypothetical protein